ncbi:inorganic phosphate transporter [Candidatus Sumerlaeota bacterium]|nr:inorganic phosphate transporter [Candidatus Sumerlaeota bacterium]
MELFLTVAAFVGLGMLIWDCLEVGRNDAANLVNAVFGARVLRRRTAVYIAGVAVVLGATFGSGVLETARKGIFDPSLLTFQMAMAIYISVYFVDTLLLYGFSGFGMPVSTTACLVFELLGAALFLAGPQVIGWAKVRTVIMAIIASIIISGVAGFLIQRVFRGGIRDKAQDHVTVLLHGPWIAGAMLTFLAWFMILKGMDAIPAISHFKSYLSSAEAPYRMPVFLLTLWAGLTLAVHLVLTSMGERGTRYLFHFTAVLGMICMAFAFGQNDLANCAGPGLSGLWLWMHRDTTTTLATRIEIPMWVLCLCGVLMAAGMATRYAQRVTRAEVNTGSQFDHVALYAPGWTRALARLIVRFRRPDPQMDLAPRPELTATGKKLHYDTLRASVITAVAASVIAFASSKGLPVSTTYVAFAAVIGTGMADRVFTRGDADLKLGRAIWVVSCWFISPVIAIVGTGLVALGVYHLGVAGVVGGLAINLVIRRLIRSRADAHERRYHEAFEHRSGTMGLDSDTMDG